VDEFELDALGGFAFEDFEEERELGDFHGLAVDVHAEDVGDEDALALGGGQRPAAAAGGNEYRVFPLGEFFGIVADMEAVIPVEQELIGDDEEGAGAAGRIEDTDGLDLFRGLAFGERADGLLDDVIDDVAGRVEDAAGFLDLRLVLDDGAVAGG